MPPDRPGDAARGRPATGRGRKPDAPALRLYLGADSESVRIALVRVAAELARLGIPGDRAGAAELALAEVLNNVVEHAFAGGRTGRIELALTPGSATLSCEVRDNGSPMPGLRPPPGDPPDTGRALADQPEGGFGWFLIRTLVDDLSYARLPGGNLTRFAIALGPQPARC